MAENSLDASLRRITFALATLKQDIERVSAADAEQVDYALDLAFRLLQAADDLITGNVPKGDER